MVIQYNKRSRRVWSSVTLKLMRVTRLHRKGVLVGSGSTFRNKKPDLQSIETRW